MPSSSPISRVAAAKPGPAVLVIVARDGQRRRRSENALRSSRPTSKCWFSRPGIASPTTACRPTPAIAARRMTVLSRLARSRSVGGQAAHPVHDRQRRSCSACRRRDGWRPKGFPPRRATWSIWTSSRAGWRTTASCAPAPCARPANMRCAAASSISIAPGMPAPVRLDFFGDTLESIRTFDPETQRTIGQLRALDLVPMSEVQLTTERIRRFRQGYVAAFRRADARRHALRGGQRGPPLPGLEHWLPLFHDRLDTLFDYLPGVAVSCSTPWPRTPRASGWRRSRTTTTPARPRMRPEPRGVAPYKPLPPEALYLAPDEWAERIGERSPRRVDAFRAAGIERPASSSIAARGRAAASPPSAPRRTPTSSTPPSRHVRELQAAGRRVIVAAWSEGSRERLCHVLARSRPCADEARRAACRRPGAIQDRCARRNLGHGGRVRGWRSRGHRRAGYPRRPPGAAERKAQAPAGLPRRGCGAHARRSRRPCRSWHRPLHGLQTIEAAGAPHDCLELHYAGGDRLFLPVENIELLSRYGSEETEVQLDRLGGVGWQARKAA